MLQRGVERLFRHSTARPKLIDEQVPGDLP
jgi:hypothetical protein